MLSYDDAVSYMMAALPMYSRIGAQAYKKDLTNTLALCNHLGNPQDKLTFVHIAGTNGKGSVSHILASLFTTAGYKTGLYTSPHYVDYRERIKIDGQFISKEFVASFIDKNKEYLDVLQPSYFEMTVGLAFAYFAAESTDIVILETGLGGRLDSTNVVNPIISVITNISYDHMDILGHTLPQIATEKAGIIKPYKPVVVGEDQLETNHVFREVADRHHAPLYYANDIIQIVNPQISNEGITCIIKNLVADNEIPIETDLVGEFQLKNIKTALSTWHVLCTKYGYKNEPDSIQEALNCVRKKTHFIGRMQWISKKPRILVDSAHNEAGVDLLLATIKTMSADKIRIVWGTVCDKDTKSILSKLPKDAIYYFAKANIPRGKDAMELQEEAKAFSLKGNAYKSVQEAYQTAKNAMSEDDILIISGSIFVVAEVI